MGRKQNINFMKKIITGTVFLIIGILVGYNISNSQSKTIIQEPQRLRAPESTYQFINPLIGFDFAEKKQFVEFLSLNDKIKEYVNEQIKNKMAQEISVYFRNVQNGHWTGLNENVEYDAGSLFKVPIMIAFLKQAESDPNLLNKKVQFKENTASTKIFGNNKSTNMQKNNYYTIDDLLRLMIVDSDNNAKDLLLENIDADYLSEVFTDLGMQYPEGRVYKISTKIYSLFFRILYNSTFLNREMSEKALMLLSQTVYNNGLTTPLPQTLKIAHKFGEYGAYEEEKLVGAQLHDCGIVYAPHNPYFICVMTQGYKIQDLEKVIQGISNIVYNHLE